MANPQLNKAILNSLFKMNPNLRDAPALNRSLAASGKSPQWIAAQEALSQGAAQSGLPIAMGTEQDAPARIRLMDAINRSHAAGFKFPYFIGKPNEPLGDRGVTMDIENLAGALRDQERAAIAAGDKATLQKISQEKAFWEKEAADGMSAAEWKSQTGESDPTYNQAIDYGMRPDNTQKQNGYFGALPRPVGGVSTELSSQMNIDGKETLVPLLVPTLNASEVQFLLNNPPDPKNTPRSILIKAADFARGRISQGLSPFAGNEEIPYGIKQ